MVDQVTKYAGKNLDELIQLYATSKDQELCDLINKTILSSSEWFLSAEVKDWDVNKRSATMPPILTIQQDGKRILVVFTTSNHLITFLKKHNLLLDSNFTLSHNPKSIIDLADIFLKDGVECIMINDGWQMEMSKLREIYFHYINPYDFPDLVKKAKESQNPDNLITLWKAIFDLPYWYFIGQPQKGELVSTRGPQGLETHMYLSLTSANSQLNQLKSWHPDFKDIVFGMQPDKAIRFLSQSNGQVSIAGLIIHDTHVNTGIVFQKIFKIHDLIQQQNAQSK